MNELFRNTTDKSIGTNLKKVPQIIKKFRNSEFAYAVCLALKNGVPYEIARRQFLAKLVTINSGNIASYSGTNMMVRSRTISL